MEDRIRELETWRPRVDTLLERIQSEIEESRDDRKIIAKSLEDRSETIDKRFQAIEKLIYMSWGIVGVLQLVIIYYVVGK